MSASPTPSLWRIEGDQLRLSFHPGQQRAWDSTARQVLMSAGYQSGKTVFGPVWLWREIREMGEGDYLAVEATYDLFKLKMLPAMAAWFHDVWGAKYYASDRLFTLAHPEARIILRSADAEGGLESASANAAWLDEAGLDNYSLASYEAVRGRLALARGRMLLTTTLYQVGWLDDVIDGWEAGRQPDWDVIQFDSTDNPAFSVEEYNEARERLPAEVFARRYRGRAVRPAGNIFAAYNPAIHRVARFDIPKEWLQYVGIDPGGSNTGVVWLAKAPGADGAATDLYYITATSLVGDTPTPDLAESIRAHAIPAGAWGGAKSEKQFRLDARKAGLAVQEPLVQDVEQGIERITAALKSNRLFIFDDLLEMHQQVRSYSRELDATGRTTDKIKDKEHYHLVDALRYVLPGVSHPPFVHIRTGKPIYTDGH